MNFNAILSTAYVSHDILTAKRVDPDGSVWLFAGKDLAFVADDDVNGFAMWCEYYREDDYWYAGDGAGGTHAELATALDAWLTAVTVTP